jgi:hypothetical protein
MNRFMNKNDLVIGLLILLAGLFFFAGCEDKEKSLIKNSFFTEITDQSQLNFIHDAAVDSSYYMPESIGSGGAFLDYDNDGDLDIYLLNGAGHGGKKIYQTPLKNHLFRQEADGTFLDVTEESGLGDTGYGMGVAVGDIDNDGDVDVYISNDGPDALYRNNGDGIFTNVTSSTGINNPDWGICVIFIDYDLDDFLDIFVANYVKYDTSTICTDRLGRRDYCGPQGFPGFCDKLFHNNGDGTFEDVSIKSGITTEQSAGLGATSADLNNDFYPDIYVGNDRQPNHLWINQKNGTFKNQALLLGCAFNEAGMSEASMGMTFGDVDDDNDLDLFMGHFRGEKNTLYRNMGEVGFKDDSAPTGLAAISLPFTGFGNGFFDYDNDSDLDLAVVNGRVIRGPLLTKGKTVDYWDYYAEPHLLFENNGQGFFKDVSQLAASFTGRVENSRTLAFGDVDNDGDIDLLVTNEGGKARLYRNDFENKGNWLLIRAYDPALHRDGYGSKVMIDVNGKTLLRMLNPCYSFCASNDPRVHVGLGSAEKVEKIIIQWPGGNKECFENITANQILTLEKGRGIPVVH